MKYSKQSIFLAKASKLRQNIRIKEGIISNQIMGNKNHNHKRILQKIWFDIQNKKLRSMHKPKNDFLPHTNLCYAHKLFIQNSI